MDGWVLNAILLGLAFLAIWACVMIVQKQQKTKRGKMGSREAMAGLQATKILRDNPDREGAPDTGSWKNDD